MSTTIILILTFAGLIVFSIVFWALSLRLGLHFVKASDVTVQRILIATLVTFATSLLLMLAFEIPTPTLNQQAMLLEVVELVLLIAVQCLIVKWIFRLSSGDPSVLYSKRLVGLPGETIEIRNGEIWVDGKKIEKPSHLADLNYTDQIPGGNYKMWASKDSPVELKRNEFFVLGDYSERLLDSRVWRTGAPGYSPFAVPDKNIRGVVTHIYWPPSRSLACLALNSSAHYEFLVRPSQKLFLVLAI